MSYVINEKKIETIALPGRELKWLVAPEMNQSDRLTFNVVNIKPGNTVRPAHSHKNHEELVYILSGSGKAFIDGTIYEIETGSALLFSAGSIHMLKNSGTVNLKAACFFTPAATFKDYTFHEEIEFPE